VMVAGWVLGFWCLASVVAAAAWSAYRTLEKRRETNGRSADGSPRAGRGPWWGRQEQESAPAVAPMQLHRRSRDLVQEAEGRVQDREVRLR